MVIPNDIQKIKHEVHQPLDWYKYGSTNTIEKTNCFSHAFGITDTSLFQYCRLGIISDKKEMTEEYKSTEEVRELFLLDAMSVGLIVEEIEHKSLFDKFSLLNTISKVRLQNNQYIVALFVKDYRKDDGHIDDFHFIRYDTEKGWSEKIKGQRVHFFEDIIEEWLTDWYYELVGVFKVTC